MDFRGIKVLVTRPAAVFRTRVARQTDDLTQMLMLRGARVLLHPVIELLPSSEPDSLKSALEHGEEYGVVVFFSPAGVWFFNDFVDQFGQSLNRLRFARVTAIGAATATALDEIGWPADLIPSVSNSQSLAEVLIGKSTGPVLLLRGNRGSNAVANALLRAHRMVHELAVYESREVPIAQPSILKQMAGGGIDWVTVTSSSIARSTIRLFAENLRRTKLASLSPTISAVISAAGLHQSAEASTPDFESMIEAMSLQPGRISLPINPYWR